jgi:phosphate transport system protein
MRVRLSRDIEKLKKRVLSLGALVEERFKMAVKAAECRDREMAQSVIDGDVEIDQLEVDLEEECLKIFALHQPVADHLRYIVAVLKMNNDLERIGDLAVNIAERVMVIADKPGMSIPFDYFTMAQRSQDMLEKALDSMVNKDLTAAYQVCAEDDDVDYMKRAMQTLFVKEVQNKPEDVDYLVNTFLISRHLERIADHATNIAEDVIYMITGEIHRHRGGEFS